MCRNAYRRTLETKVDGRFQFPKWLWSGDAGLGRQRSPAVNFASEIDRRVIRSVVPQGNLYLENLLTNVRLHKGASDSDRRHSQEIHILPDTDDVLAPE